MMLVAFDQAPSSIGFAYGEPGALQKADVFKPGSYGKNEALLGIEVYNWALELLKPLRAHSIYVEQIIQRQEGFQSHTFDQQAMVRSVIQIAAVHAGVDATNIYEIMIADWRREFYGDRRPAGNVKSKVWKDLARVECARRGWLVEDHNAAEACGLWFFASLRADPRLRANHKIQQRRAELKAMQEQTI